MNTSIKIIAIIFLFILSSCENLVPELERNNPNDLRNGQARLAISEVNVLNGSGQLTTARPGSTVYINVSIIHYGESGTGVIIKNIKGVFNVEGSNYIRNVVPAFGTPISFYRNVANREVDLAVGQTAYAVAFPQNFSTYAFRADISQDAVHGEEMGFNMELSDDTGRNWNNSFKIIID